MKKIIRLNVNGKEHEVAIRPAATLQDVLREDLGLTGTKKACGLGVCGACTVIMDGKAVNSCLILAELAQGHEITTIEGVARKGRLHPLQKSFVEEGGLQCGFCTPGMIMSAKALIDKNPKPSVDEIKEALAGNLCRCTGYTKIIDSVKNWKKYEDENAKGVREHDLDKFATVGRSIPRVDAPDKVTGKAKYTADFKFPRMLYGKILKSPIAHGIIKRIDTSKAEALPGVHAVITGKDVPDVKTGVSPARYDKYILAKGKVRYVGDEIAAVAAEDEATAEEALKLIEIEFEQLPAVLDPFSAIKDGAPQLHEEPNYKNNINTRVDHHFGDIDKGFAEADYIREEKFVGNHVYQSPMEPHASIAMTEEDGTTVLYSSTQVPHYLHYQIARVFNRPLGKFRIVRPHVGGGFGGKAEASCLDYVSIILAEKTRRPVKMVFTRKDMFEYFRGRHKQYMTYKIGVKKNGKITAVKSEIYLDGGAYTSFGIVSAYYAGSMVATLYHIPNYKYDGYRMYTNKPPCGAMRGHGCPQPRFAFESLLNMIADDLKMDPIELRLINAMDPNTRTVNDLDIRSCEFKATLKAVREKSNWKNKYGKLPKGKGIGIGCGGFVSGAGYPIYRSKFPHSNAIVRVNEDGSQAVCMIAAAEIGQGSDTVLTQMCAEGLGLPPERVKIRSWDTEIGPIDLGAYSSRITLMGGNAVKRAGDDIRKKILPYAAKVLGCAEGELVAENGVIRVKGKKDKFMPWAEAARMFFSENGPLVGTGCYSPPEGLGGKYKGAAVGTSPAYSFGSSVCEVSVDLETGKVKLEKFTDFHDCGTPVNPLAVHGQVEGAIVMGAGETIMEDTVFNDKGQVVNPNLHEYLIMTIKDAPEISSGLVESYEPEGPYGAKEIGEGSTLPVLGAVAHAIANATGVWIKELPITPEKILKALNNGKCKACKVPGKKTPRK
jgi:4-hydroxybenzoyl-CoA reductase alpha subunit/xanthine dehydrogenase E subunit